MGTVPEKYKQRDGVKGYPTKDGDRYAYRVVVTNASGAKEIAQEGGFLNRTAAKRAKAAALAKSQAGTFVADPKLTVGAWLDQWLATKRKGRAMAETAVRLYLKPHLGALPLKSLTSSRVAQFYIGLEQDGRTAGGVRTTLSPGTVRLAANVLGTALQAAVEHEPPLLSRNPARTKAARDALPKAQAVRDGIDVVWADEQIDAFLAWAAENDRDYLLWRFYAYTGARNTEATGVRWQDISATSAYLPRTKGDRPRTAPLDAETLALLAACKKERGALALDLARPSALVFGDENGRAPSASTVAKRLDRSLVRFRRDVGVTEEDYPRITPHSLRRSFVTNNLDAGAPAAVIGATTGQSVETLLSRYVKVAKKVNVAEEQAARARRQRPEHGENIEAARLS